jgi:hypothetical protein
MSETASDVRLDGMTVTQRRCLMNACDVVKFCRDLRLSPDDAIQALLLARNLIEADKRGRKS